ncbi:MAG: hypothetical protein JXK07_06365, partial [Spirochaetes bacterium]|nr:hypothetical protein [Spirochaetota bacterium]
MGDFLPYVTVAHDFIVSEKPSQLTAILETRLSELDDDDVMQAKHDLLMNVLCDVMPQNSTLSIYLTKRFINEKLSYRTACSNDLIKHLDKKTIDTFNSKSYPHFACFFAITIPVISSKSFSLNNSESKENVDFSDYTETTEVLNNLIHAITSRVQGTVIRLISSQILGFLSVLINHYIVNTYADLNGVLSGDFNSTSNAFNKLPGYVYYGGNYHSVLSLRSVGSESRLPSETTAALNKIFYQSNDLCNIPFTIHHSIKFLSKQHGLTTASFRRNNLEMKKGLAKRNALFAKTEEGITPEKLYDLISHSISIVENSNHKFVNQFFQVHLWHENLDELWRRVRLFRNTVSSSFLLKPEKFNIKPAFYSIFPGNESINKINSMLATYTVADFMPIDLPRECLPDSDPAKGPEHVFFQTQSGSIARLCLFSTLCNAHNSIIVGGTGSGKSFLQNSLLYQAQAGFDPAIYIIDVGGENAGSYMNFILNNHGTYVQISADNPFSMNPFDGQLLKEDKNGQLKPDEIKFEALQSILKRMIGSVDGKDTIEPLNKDVEFHLNKAIIQYYIDNDNNQGNKCNLDEFAQKYLKTNKEIINAGVDVFKALAPFIGSGIETGIYAAYFRATDEIKNPNIVCFDLMGLASRPRLASVLIPTLLDMIIRAVGGKEFAHRRKLIIVDEAWKFLKDPSVGGFIQEMYSTIRKLNGSITLLTQNLQTIMESPIAGSILINTSYYYLMGSNHIHDPDDNPPKTPLL